MIIMKLQGGLGNQLFQYALGRRLALKNATELKLDISRYHEETEPRKFALPHFSIDAGIATAADYRLMRLPNPQSRNFFARVVRKAFRMIESTRGTEKRAYVLEPSLEFCPDILKIEGSAYLSGDWQSEEYFISIRETLRKDLALKAAPSPLMTDWIRRMQACNAVSLHIRRGDYVQNAKTNQFHGVCSLDYYDAAMRLICESVQDPVYFVFSDDIGWARQNLRTNGPALFVSDESIPDYEEMVLMSRCSHNIIANSSFSWWGAWLNAHEEKIVIAPSRWFNAEAANLKMRLPPAWIRI